MIRVDPDWESAKDGESFWLNVPVDNSTLYCSLNVQGNSATLTGNSAKDLTKAGVWINCQKKSRSLLVEVQSNGASVIHHLRNPYESRNLRKGYISALSTTDNLIATAHPNGSIYVWSDLNGTLARTYNAHHIDVNTVQFFPSGTVLLSGGGDMVLKVWSLAQEDICVAEFKGHQRGVLSTGFVERGRNIVSSSRDGTVILWDVPTQAIIHSWGDPKLADAINECHVSVGVPSGEAVLDPREVGTDGKILFCAAESGKLLGYDTRSRSEILSCRGTAALNAVTSIHQTSYVISGAQDGVVACWDTRNHVQPLYSFKASAVTKLLAKSDKQQCWVSCGDGTTFCWDYSAPLPTLSLVSDTEPITGISFLKEDVITSSRRGSIRVYSIPNTV